MQKKQFIYDKYYTNWATHNRTTILIDNTTVEGITNRKIQSECTKGMDMRLHWLRDQKAQGQLRFTWLPGKTNLADYFTKHHPLAHHVKGRSKCLTKIRDKAKIRRQKMQ